MGTTADVVTGTICKTVERICTIRPQNRTHLQQTTAEVGVIVNPRMVTTVVTSTTQSISAGPVISSYNNGHLVFLTKDKHMMCPYSNRLVPQLWNTLNGISQKC